MGLNLIIVNLVKRMIQESNIHAYLGLEIGLSEEIAHKKKEINLRGWINTDVANAYVMECLNELALAVELLLVERERLSKTKNMNSVEFRQMMKLGKLLNKIMGYQEDFAAMSLDFIKDRE